MICSDKIQEFLWEPDSTEDVIKNSSVSLFIWDLLKYSDSDNDNNQFHQIMHGTLEWTKTGRLYTGLNPGSNQFALIHMIKNSILCDYYQPMFSDEHQIGREKLL